MNPRLNSLAWMPSITFGGNLAPSLRWSMVWGCFSAAGTGRLVRNKWKLNWAKYGEILDDNLLQSAQDFRLGRRFTFNRTTTLSTQSRQRRSGFGTSLWMSFSGPARAELETNRTSLERPENRCAETLPIQPDRTSEDLQRGIVETPQIQVCQACSIIPKKTRGCNHFQRSFNKVQSKGSEYLCKRDFLMFEKLFFLCHYGVLHVHWWRKTFGKSQGVWILSDCTVWLIEFFRSACVCYVCCVCICSACVCFVWECQCSVSEGVSFVYSWSRKFTYT